jgi:TetR/AcrR family transcriptional repressor of nem operon
MYSASLMPWNQRRSLVHRRYCCPSEKSSSGGLTIQNRMSILISMVRTRTFDPSSALNSIVDLFAAKGYSETSMEDIVAATGVSRYGLYSAFGNKRELFEQALERFAEGMGKRSYLRLLEPDASLSHIRAIFADRVQDICHNPDNKGCLFVHTATELAPQDDEIRGVLQKFMQRMSKTFAIGLESAKERGEIRDNVDTSAAGDLLTSTMFGLAVMGRSGFDETALNGLVDSVLGSLSG